MRTYGELVPLEIGKMYLSEQAHMVIDPDPADYADIVARDDSERTGEVVLTNLYVSGYGHEHEFGYGYPSDVEITDSLREGLRADCAMYLAEHPGTPSVRADVIRMRYDPHGSVAQITHVSNVARV